MPKKRATRVYKHAKPKKPEGEISDDMDAEQQKERLHTFLQDFDLEVTARLRKIKEAEEKLIGMLEKEVRLQLSFIPAEIRQMNIMDFCAAGGTIEDALIKLDEQKEGDSFVDDDFGKTLQKGNRKGKGTISKKNPPSTAKSSKTRSRFQTPATRHLPAMWDTPAVTPKFDVNLPFTPAITREPKHGERFMSLAGSPLAFTAKAARTMKNKRIQEDNVDDALVDEIASGLPTVSRVDVKKILARISSIQNR